MKMTGKQIVEATTVLVDIANNPRTIPQMAKYKLARMHDALEPYFIAMTKERTELVQKYGSEKHADADKKISLGWNVSQQDRGFEDYKNAWEVITAKEYMVNIKPITTSMLGNDPKGLEMVDFKALGELVVDNTSGDVA